MSDNFFSAKNLLEHFFSGCESNLRFLEQRHGFSYISGLAEYRNNSKIIRPWRGQEITETFTALTRYERADTSLEILFGEQQFIIESLVYYGPYQRFSLSEILKAARKIPKGKTNDWGITRPQLIDESLGRIAKNLLSHHKVILEPNTKFLDRMLTIRNVQLEQAVRRHFSQTIKDATLLAAKAFREKNFRMVISVLEPYKNFLPSSELKKLQIAKKQLLSH
jgi:hypothetical protein